MIITVGPMDIKLDLTIPVIIAPRRPRATRITQLSVTSWEATLGAVNFSDKMGEFR
jgi:hypothetical protein